jgi:hypothetical protein
MCSTVKRTSQIKTRSETQKTNIRICWHLWQQEVGIERKKMKKEFEQQR